MKIQMKKNKKITKISNNNNNKIKLIFTKCKVMMKIKMNKMKVYKSKILVKQNKANN